jgi:hypothetical protein
MSLWGLIKVELTYEYFATNYAIVPAERALVKRFESIKS